MLFRTAPVNRAARVTAAVVLLSFGAPLLLSRSILFMMAGLPLAGVGVGVIVFEAVQAVQRHRSRPDRYDLSLLKETEGYRGPSRDDPDDRPEIPAWETENGDTVYCHRCDVSMPATYSVCPQCGAILA